MKPAEILGMIEEAAGTRMYESKRISALKTIDKKQMKVDEINSVLSEEITPTLERLRAEKQNYLRWSKNNSKIERMDRMIVAHNFWRAKTALDTQHQGTDDMEAEANELQIQAEGHKSEIEETAAEIREKANRLSGEVGTEMSALKATEEKLSKELVKATSGWQNSKTVVAGAQNDLSAAQELLRETEAAVKDKERKMAAESESIDACKREAEEADGLHEQLKTDYQSMSAGIASSQGEGRTLPEQISGAHNESKAAEAKAKQAEMKVQHLSKTIEVRGRTNGDTCLPCLGVS